MSAELNKALEFLVEKYDAPSGEIIAVEGMFKIRVSNGEFPLLPWRVERRFVELKNLIVNNTLEHVSTMRFSSMTAGGCLFRQVARELDLATWMVHSPVVSLFAACSGGAVANLVVKLANAVSVSIECGNRLPEGEEAIDRHEMIARRGVASDRVVDTQVPQSSIYAFTNKGSTRYTDTDAEIFGLDEEKIRLVRAAYAVLQNPALGDEWNAANAVMNRLVEAVKKSDSTSSVISLEGDEKR